MAGKKPPAERYVVLRDFAEYVAGDTVTLDAADAALLMRDGFVALAQE